ncbi:MAG: hypothetical protein QM820_00840 [Minicystis sp.]
MSRKADVRALCALLSLVGGLSVPGGAGHAGPIAAEAQPMQRWEAVPMPEDPACPSCTFTLWDKELSVTISRTYAGPAPLSNTTLSLYDVNGHLLGTYAREDELSPGSSFTERFSTASDDVVTATLTWTLPDSSTSTQAIVVVR